MIYIYRCVSAFSWNFQAYQDRQNVNHDFKTQIATEVFVTMARTKMTAQTLGNQDRK